MKTVIQMILTLSILGIIAGGSLAFVDDWSSPLVAANRKAETERAIFLVQPAGKSYEKIENAGFEVYKVFDDQKNLLGYSLVYEGNGFQGKIRMIAGVNPALDKITSVEILEQVETPGLGTKIMEEPFIGQFKGLTVFPAVTLVKGLPPSKPSEVQAITGATISSKALVAIINEGISKMRILKEKGGI